MNEYLERTMSADESALKQKLTKALDGMSSCEITKTQFNFKGRAIYLPIMAFICTVIYSVFIYCTSWVLLELRYFLVAIETLIYGFFLLKFCFSFAMDVKSRRFAEKITYKKGADGKRYFLGEGLSTTKFEYEGGNICMWGKAGKENYDKFEDKGKFSPFASRFDRNLQRRSSSYKLFTVDFLFAHIVKGSFTVTENSIKSVSEEGSFSIAFDGENIKSIYYVGNADMFYDSVSPLHFFDTKIPFSYSFSYKFDKINALAFTLKVPKLAQDAIKDFLLPQPDSSAVTFI